MRASTSSRQPPKSSRASQHSKTHQYRKSNRTNHLYNNKRSTNNYNHSQNQALQYSEISDHHQTQKIAQAASHRRTSMNLKRNYLRQQIKKLNSSLSTRQSKNHRDSSFRKNKKKDDIQRARSFTQDLRDKRRQLEILPKEFRESFEKTKFKNKYLPRFEKGKMVEYLMRNRKLIMHDNKLLDGVKQLRKLRLLKAKSHQMVKNTPCSSKGYTQNDYHNSNTNNGYSRNVLGTFFYR